MPAGGHSRSARGKVRRLGSRKGPAHCNGVRADEESHPHEGGAIRAMYLALGASGALALCGFVVVAWRLEFPQVPGDVALSTLPKLRGLGNLPLHPSEPLVVATESPLAPSIEVPKAAAWPRPASPAEAVEVVTASIAPALEFAEQARRRERDAAAELLRTHPEAAQAGVYAGCVWTAHRDSFLGEYLVGETNVLPKPTSVDDAKAACETAAACMGVTCDDGEQHMKCTPRLGTPYLAHSSTGELSFTKACGGAVEAALASDRTAVAVVATALPDAGTVGKGSDQATLPRLDPAVQPQATPLASLKSPLNPDQAVLVVIAHNNRHDLEVCLRSLLALDGISETVTVAVSLDDPDSFQKMESSVQEVVETAAAAQRVAAKQRVQVWKKKIVGSGTVVKKISEHHRFVLQESFEQRGFKFAILLENDLAPAPDFMWYFRTTAWLLEEDRSLFCVSAWNDNGFRDLVSDERRLFRTDYFPGLGWMLRQDTWDMIRQAWPNNPTTGWDHWLRHGSDLRPRECIVPEVPRVRHFGLQGANVRKGTEIAKTLERMALSSLPAGALGNVSYLLNEAYSASLRKLLAGAQLLTGGPNVLNSQTLRSGAVYVVPYLREEYRDLAKRLRIYASQPRAAHRGLVLTQLAAPGGGFATIALVDRRREIAAWALPEGWALAADGRRVVAAAGPGESCDKLCKRKGLLCSPRELEFINSCAEMRRAFPCENGCGHQVGNDIPAYVHSSARDTAHQCLVTDDSVATCSAACPATTRLCACLPPESPREVAKGQNSVRK